MDRVLRKARALGGALALQVLYVEAKELAMLRITTKHEGNQPALQLEGKLAGAWVKVAQECWEQQREISHGEPVQVDLRAVSYVDAAGKALLAEMSRQNAKFYACDCQMKAILGEIASPTKTSV